MQAAAANRHGAHYRCASRNPPAGQYGRREALWCICQMVTGDAQQGARR